MDFDLMKFCEEINDLLDRKKPIAVKIKPTFERRDYYEGFSITLDCEFVNAPVRLECTCDGDVGWEGSWFVDDCPVGIPSDVHYADWLYQLNNTANRIGNRWLTKMESEVKM